MKIQIMTFIFLRYLFRQKCHLNLETRILDTLNNHLVHVRNLSSRRLEYISCIPWSEVRHSTKNEPPPRWNLQTLLSCKLDICLLSYSTVNGNYV